MAEFLATLQSLFTIAVVFLAGAGVIGMALVMPLAAEFGKRAKAGVGADGRDAVGAAAAADPP